MPLAPNNAELKRSALSMAVMNAVSNIRYRMILPVYFSSKIGPKSKIMVKLPTRCSIF